MPTRIRVRRRFNYNRPQAIQQELGPHALESQLTAGHFAARKNDGITAIFERTIEWIRQHPGIAKENDQAYLHLALLIGGLRTQNLCQPPHNWPSPWAGDYRNTLDVVQAAQGAGRLLQLHYSGGLSHGYDSREDFLYAGCTNEKRLRHLVGAALSHWSGHYYLSGRFVRGVMRRLPFLSKRAGKVPTT